MSNKIDFEAPSSSAFKYATPGVIQAKSALLTLCGGIDRNFRNGLNIEITKDDVSDSSIHSLIAKKYTLLEKMNDRQFTEFLELFVEIRHLCAHLYSHYDIKISNELIDYLTTIKKPQYKIAVDNKLTTYGIAYALTFLARKYQAWPSFNNLFKSRYFKKIKSNDSTGMFTYLSECCAPGKEDYLNEDLMPVDVGMFNNTLQKNIIKIMFEIEKASFNNYSVGYNKSTQFGQELERVEGISNPADIRILRNAFFHGFYLFDTITTSTGISKKITYEFIIDTISQLRIDVANNPVCKKLCESIEHFGKDILGFFFNTAFEVSYKLLDKRLLEKEKIDERIKRSVTSFSRLGHYKKYYNKACSLIPKQSYSWSLQKRKFKQVETRETTREIFELIEIISDNGFMIGPYMSKSNKMYLMDVDIDNTYQTKINGAYLQKIKKIKVKSICPFIDFYRAKINM